MESRCSGAMTSGESEWGGGGPVGSLLEVDGDADGSKNLAKRLPLPVGVTGATTATTGSMRFFALA